MAEQAQESTQTVFEWFGITLSADLIAPSALFAIATCIFGLILKIIKDDRDRIRLFFLLEETPFWTAYGRFLKRLSGGFDRFFGANLFGIRAFSRCFLLALIYPYIALVITFGFTRVNTTASIQTMALMGLVMALASGVGVFIVTRRFKAWSDRRKAAARGVTVLMWTGVEYGFYFLLGILAVAVAVAAAGALAVTVTVAVVVLIFIFLCVPILNAALDWPSWAASRWLMRRLEQDVDRGAWLAIAGHMLLDVALAVFFLAALTAIFANIFLGLGLDSASQLRDISLFHFAETDPWGNGFWLTAMLLSTLVPTVIHLAAALGALLIAPPPLRRLPLRYLEDADPSTLHRWAAAGYLTGWVMLAFGLAGAAIWGLFYGITYHGQTLWSLVFNLANYLVIFGG